MSSPADSPTVRLLTASDVAAALKVSKAYVYLQKHRIGFVRFGRVVRFQPAALERFIATRTENIPAAIASIDLGERRDLGDNGERGVEPPRR